MWICQSTIYFGLVTFMSLPRRISRPMNELCDQQGQHMGPEVCAYYWNPRKVYGKWQSTVVKNLGSNNSTWIIEFQVLPLALSCHVLTWSGRQIGNWGIWGTFLPRDYSQRFCREEPQGRAQETGAGSKRALAKSRPEKRRGWGRNQAAEGESCRFCPLGRSQSKGFSRKGEHLYFLSKLPPGQPQMEADSREQERGVRSHRRKWKRPAHS